MKKLLLVSLLFVQGLLTAAEAADGAGNLQQSAPFPTLKFLVLQELVSDRYFYSGPVDVIESIMKTSVYIDPERALADIYAAWLSRNSTASIIVVQNGKQACLQMGIRLDAIPAGWEQLTVDISRYVGPDTPINNLHLRPGTIAHLIDTKRAFCFINGRLDLTGQNLTVCDVFSIPDPIKKGIRFLNLQGNKFQHLPPNTFAGLDCLEELSLDENPLTHLTSNAFAGLSSLKILSLQKAPLTHIAPNVFVGLSSLNLLYLNNNKLAHLEPNTFAGLDSLNELLLNNNQLRYLVEDTFKGLGALKALNLDNNQLTTIARNAFAGLNCLEGLCLTHNQLTHLAPHAFAGLNALTELWLSNDNPEDLNALRIEQPAWFGLPVGVGN